MPPISRRQSFPQFSLYLFLLLALLLTGVAGLTAPAGKVPSGFFAPDSSRVRNGFPKVTVPIIAGNSDLE